MGSLEDDLKTLLNKYSQENASNTPDFILAAYLLGCLENFNQTVQAREVWYGRDLKGPGQSSVGETTLVVPERP